MFRLNTVFKQVGPQLTKGIEVGPAESKNF